MFESRKSVAAVVTVVIWVLGASSSIRAQERPWWEFEDFESGIVCSLVHAANVDLVVLRSGGEMMVASPPNNVLADVVVDDNFDVFFDGSFAGSIAFAEDADGDRALFWLTITGRVVEVGDFDASPSPSDSSPGDIKGTGCDVCARYPALAGCGPDDDDDDDTVSSPLTALCGAGTGAAAMLSLGLLLVGKGRRVSRRGKSGARISRPQRIEGFSSSGDWAARIWSLSKDPRGTGPPRADLRLSSVGPASSRRAESQRQGRMDTFRLQDL